MGRKHFLTVTFLALSLLACAKAPFADYQDGSYVGEGQGRRRHLKVEITLADGRMTDCRVVEQYEGAYYAKEPLTEIPKRILEAQDPRVDGISGSTLTSEGIMKAVENALEQAGNP